jgi:hypothetical protein
MGSANCMMSHTSAVNSNVDSYRNAPDNLNCMWLTHLTTEQFICANSVMCYTTAVTGNLDSWWDAPDHLVSCSQLFLFVIQV